jgi:hypothetical protein
MLPRRLCIPGLPAMASPVAGDCVALDTVPAIVVENCDRAAGGASVVLTLPLRLKKFFLSLSLSEAELGRRGLVGAVLVRPGMEGRRPSRLLPRHEIF